MRDLRDIGFGESQSAATFLREFGLLKIDHQPSLTIRGKLVASSTAFDPLRVCTERDVTVASRCSEIVGAKLFPIGVDSFHMTIYMADNLSLYAGVDASVYDYAENFAQLLENMLVGVRPGHCGSWN
jgi:hypothetical protein